MVALSPTAIRRWIAIDLRRMREASGRTPAQAAERLGKSAQAYRHYETRERAPSASDMEVLLNWYGQPERVPFYRELIRAAQRGTDWWESAGVDVPQWFEAYLGLEVGAASISSYDSQWVPGLLQTAAYARALYSAGERGLANDEIDRRVQLRMSRQDILTRADDPPQVTAVLDESVLRRHVGGRRGLAEQLDRLLSLAGLPNVTLHILEDRAGAHAGTEGTFTILRYPADFRDDPGAVYVETRVEGTFYEDPTQIADFQTVLDSVLAAAAPPDTSLDLISRAAKDL